MRSLLVALVGLFLTGIHPASVRPPRAEPGLRRIVLPALDLTAALAPPPAPISELPEAPAALALAPAAPPQRKRRVRVQKAIEWQSPQEALTRALRRGGPRLRPCAAQARRPWGQPAAPLELVARVRGAGGVASVEVVDSGTSGAPFAACVARALRRLALPPLTEDASLRLRVLADARATVLPSPPRGGPAHAQGPVSARGRDLL